MVTSLYAALLLFMVCGLVSAFVRHETYNPHLAVNPGNFIGSGTGNVVIVTNVTQGTLKVNGISYAINTLTSRTGQRHHFSFGMGNNTVVLHAPPFRDVTCTFVRDSDGVAVPIDGKIVVDPTAYSSPCHDALSFGLPLQHSSQQDHYVGITVGTAQLPSVDTRSLTQLLQKGMQQLEGAGQLHTQVPPGQLYTAGQAPGNPGVFPVHILTRDATTPVPAAIKLVDTTPFDYWGDMDSLVPQPSGGLQDWYVPVSYTPVWSFTESGGTHSVRNDVTFFDGFTTYIRLSTGANQSGQSWALDEDVAAGSAQVIYDLCAAEFTGAPMLTTSVPAFLKDTFYTLDHVGRIAGCTGTLTFEETRLGRFAISFGVVYAVDAAAHRSVPDLPVIPPALLKQIAQ